MFKQLVRRPWICPSCLDRQSKRRLVGVAAAAAPAHHSQSGPSRTDDDTLRRLFDSQTFWKDFSNRGRHSGQRNRGLLQNKHLTGPQGYLSFAQESLDKCRKLVRKLERAETNEDYRTFARDFDRLSDLLCRVIDSVEFIRNVHPDGRIQQAATQAYAHMFEYMNILNTHKGLYDQLKKAASIPEVVASWTQDDKTTTQILLKDFQQSAIAEPEHVRKKFVDLSSEIAEVGSDMMNYMSPEKEYVRFNSSQLKGMDPVTVRGVTRYGTSTLPVNGRAASLALKTVDDPEVRKEIYMATRTASRKSVSRVEHLLRKRAELARLCGHESVAHMTLSDKMAKTPGAVNQFLNALATENRPKVTSDLSELLSLKSADFSNHTNPSELQIQAWDRAYYTRRLRSRLLPQNRPSDLLSAYFSLGTVMQGLSRLFTRLFGVHLQPRETSPGETWNDDIRRLDVLDEDEGHIAVLYCDLFARPSKTPNPAHFTLRCSREISQTEIDEATAAGHLSPNPSLEELSMALNDGLCLNYSRSKGTLHQLPTIAFICDFPLPSPGSQQPTLLSFQQVSTLFHEMGHCIHSILGRTSLQNVAGTRCATDFAELPSILMEYFAASPEVLGLYARHWETDRSLDTAVVTEELARSKRLAASAETEAQILFSVLDQSYHGPGLGEGFDSTAMYLSIYNNPLYASTPEPRGTAWQGFFGHLYGYGGVYYSYLFDRAIAGRVWRDVFAASTGMHRGPLDREAGQRYRDEVLMWGGSRDPWINVAGVLGGRYEWMGEGGEKAMEEVGRWGVGDGGEGSGGPM